MFALPIEPPVQPIHHPLFTKHGVEVFMKRDDMIHPFISGNKWRKLKYIVDDAKQQNAKHLVSFGGAYSNHLVALACAGAMAGFTTTAFVRGEEVSNPMLNLCKLYGMGLIFVSREAYRNKRVLYTEFAQQNASTYFIDEGGKGDFAAKGCEEILTNTSTQITHAICAVGTGTTLAGLAKRAKLLGITAEGVCVLKGAENMDGEIAQLAGYDVKVHHQFHRGGYAKTDAELLNFIKDFASRTGILLDQVYTAKLMMALAQLIDEGYYQPKSKIMAVHTGGLLGMMSVLNP
jgi:1-aminocyclopropane-1-carboxylate deaminase